MSKCFGIKYFFIIQFQSEESGIFFKIPNAILYKTEFGNRKKMPKLPARGAHVPGGEHTSRV